jgi:hypothetical protein
MRNGGLLLIEGDRKVIIDDVQAGLHRSSASVAFPLDPTLQPVFDHIVSTLRKLEERGPVGENHLNKRIAAEKQRQTPTLTGSKPCCSSLHLL